MPTTSRTAPCTPPTRTPATRTPTTRTTSGAPTTGTPDSLDRSGPLALADAPAAPGGSTGLSLFDELPTPLPPLTEQADRLVELGVADLAGLSPARLHELTASGTVAGTPLEAGLLVVSPRLAPVSALAPLLRRDDREGFVVADMTDVDDFAPIPGLDVPDSPVYVIAPPDRGDDLANWSPDEALPELEHRGRSPLTLAEGVHWLLQAPGTLERNHCFMTIGSRLRKPNGRLDARTPALWLANGTGRDGRERRGATKVGWCWTGNRHTWLGFASTTSRTRS